MGKKASIQKLGRLLQSNCRCLKRSRYQQFSGQEEEVIAKREEFASLSKEKKES